MQEQQQGTVRELTQLEMVPSTASGSKVQPGLSKARLLFALEIRICAQEDAPQPVKTAVFKALSLQSGVLLLTCSGCVISILLSSYQVSHCNLKLNLFPFLFGAFKSK